MMFIIGMSTGIAIAVLVFCLARLGAAHRASEQDMAGSMARIADAPIPRTPPVDLNDGVDITCTITQEPLWKAGDEIVSVETPNGTIIFSRVAAERYGIEGTPGKVVDG